MRWPGCHTGAAALHMLTAALLVWLGCKTGTVCHTGLFPYRLAHADCCPAHHSLPWRGLQVRMMLPMTVRCNVCGTFMYKVRTA